METIGSRVKQRREELKLSQNDLAARSGVSQGTIGNLESGLRKKPKDLLSIARTLGLNPYYLETGKGEKFATWPFETITQDEIRALTTEQLQALEDTIRSALAMASIGKAPTVQKVLGAKLSVETRDIIRQPEPHNKE